MLVLLFSAWQHFELLRHGYRLEQMQRERAGEEEINRHLRLEIETLRSPARIERLATGRLHLVAPGADEAIGDRARRSRRRRRRGRSSRAGRTETEFAVADQPANVWRTTLKRRLAVAVRRSARCGRSAIEARLVYLQVVPPRRARRRAPSASSRAPSRRRPSAATSSIATAACSPTASTPTRSTPCRPRSATPTQAAAALCGALGDCTPKDRQALAERIRKGKHFAYVRRQVSPDQARARRRAEARRASASSRRAGASTRTRSSASHLLGYVGIDNDGLSGIEATYDSLIRGKPGTVLVQTDARRHAFSRVERPPTTGASLELTIDQYLQHIAERELRAGVESSGAAGGSAIVMDPHTGEILALAN